MSFAAGENVGPYRILEQLGQGGVASVYKAYHPALERYVAIKVLHPAFKEDPTFLARFRREARVVAQLEHPNIVPVYDFAEHNEQPYLVMKYIEGETLKARLSHGPISIEEGVHILTKIGAALHYANSRDILHRDVKPSNILIDPQNRIYLADFGLARIASAGESTLSSDMLMGTPNYISPEQARGDRDLDNRTDIYSLGVVLYEMVVGRVPFKSDTPFSVIHDHIFTPLPLPSRINPAVPQEVERILLKALAKERADRFNDVLQMVNGFKKVVTDGKIEETIIATPRVTSDSQEKNSQIGSFSEPDVKISPDKIKKKKSGSTGRKWLWWGAGLAIILMITLIIGSVLAGVGLFSPDSGSFSYEEIRDNPDALVGYAEALYYENQYDRAFEMVLEAAQLYEQHGDFQNALHTLEWAMEVPELKAEHKFILEYELQRGYFLWIGEGSRDTAATAEERYPDWQIWPARRLRIGLSKSGPVSELERNLNEQMPKDPGNIYVHAVYIEFLVLHGERERSLIEADKFFSNHDIPEWLILHVDAVLQE